MAQRPRPSSFAIKAEASCAAALSKWMELDDPADIDNAVSSFVPLSEPQRSETLHMLVQMMKLSPPADADSEELLATVMHAVTLKVVQQENKTGRRSVSRKYTVDEALDLVKIVLVGDSGVGKTSLMLRFVQDKFITATRSTVGMDFSTRQLSVDMMHGSESSIVQQLTVQVWDTAGQELFRSLAATYYRRAGGVMLLYDSQNPQTFESLDGWLKDVQDNSDGPVVMIVASKSEGTNTVSASQGEVFAKKHGCMFAALSSKEGTGVVAAFKALAEKVLERQEVDELHKNYIKESISLADDKIFPKKGDAASSLKPVTLDCRLRY
eukprot:CAMPEP_0119393098 /NCGR_PEP_ID=MMETSP1334-20130426/124115_1 /TAXON_ID=127549 /ORGANISM="Calcidiscus leptoporus, Strain RCC1130" /LENGTH=323 /DNA_ID=CAMNT_0007416093 /DNA_START=45 /DNA_END=1017 /DNA_ORIENTATION=-